MITIRFVSSNDIQHIQSIANETWIFTYERIYPIDYIHNFLNTAYSNENLSRSVERDIKSSKREFLIAENDNHVVGYAQTRQVNEEEYELLRIYVRPEYQKMGIGNAFLDEFSNILKPIKKLIAWVGKENRIGRSFYDKKGFSVVEEKIETREGHSTTLIKYELEITNK